MKNAHDKLFKQMVSMKSEAIALAKTFLPEDLLAEVDLDSFELSNVSFINKNLQEYFADVIYDCKTRNNQEIREFVENNLPVRQ